MLYRVLKIYPLPNTTVSENLLKSLIKRREDVPREFYRTGAMIDRTWTTANLEMRRALTRLAVRIPPCHLEQPIIPRTIRLMQMYTL